MKIIDLEKQACRILCLEEVMLYLFLNSDNFHTGEEWYVSILLHSYF